jgi:hypothetical protein
MGWQGHVYDISLAPALTEFVRDGTVRFQADRAVVVRDYSAGPSAVSFTIHTGKTVRLTMEEFASGSLRLEIAGRGSAPVTVRDRQASFSIPLVERKVCLQKV